MSKTIRLLSTYKGHRPQTILTVDDATATALLAGGLNATTDLTGGVRYVPPILPPQVLPAAFQIDANGAVSLVGAGFQVAVPTGGTRRRAVFVGDSLTQHGQPGKTGPEYQLQFSITTITSAANFGGITWIAYAMVDGRANGGVAQTVAGNLFTDSRGWVAWQAAGDTIGQYVDVSVGGWHYLKSGTYANSGITLAVRGASAPVPNATSAVQTAGSPITSDYNLIGYVAWVAGAFGDTFYDYEAFAIAGASSADILKFAPQAFLLDTEVAVIMGGVNDLPTTDAACNVTVANLKGIIDIASAKARRVYVQEIFPNPSATPAIVKNLAYVSQMIKAYCATKKNVKFVSAYGKMVNANTWVVGSGAGGRAGVFNPADNLHTQPYGGWIGGSAVVDAMSKDYPIEAPEYTTLDTWNPVLQIGSLNTNPTLRGSAGAGSGSNGITGPIPDGWTGARSGGGVQVCVTSFKPAPDGGLDLFAMAVSGAGAAGEYHEISQIVPLPTNVTAGDYVQLVAETCILSTTGNGIGTLTIYAAGGATQLPYLLQTSRAIQTFTTEAPVLKLRSFPMEILQGVTSFTMRLRVGCAYTAGVSGAGEIGFRKFRFEKCAAPVYGVQ
ncbi:hypothetical protein CR152_10195 [Massilia violaceinigra]|uniref:SGNH hydrolase-type esterase domain-containing protein n=1 Tax=Massilia violaceinigra TaxID=2045208 RepID=A0A2D2DIR1_9BURK|nr:SGNH/GDSL hydrolase family protein [Massilia violaceinigra]ATQ74851.1 hypothetical protein CR152_10195 [Massilia violaceinigra]